MKKLIFLLVINLLCTPCFGGVNLNGDADYINISLEPNLGTSNYSILVAFKTSTGTGAKFFTGGIKDSGTYDEVIYVGFFDGGTCSTGELEFGARDTDGNAVDEACSSNTFNDGKNHIALFRQDTSGDMTIYVDGVLEATTTTTGNSDGAKDFTGNPFIIGGWNNRGVLGDFIDSDITEFAFWDTLLTVDEAILLTSANVKRLPLQIQPNNLLGYWSLDQGSDGTFLNTTSGFYKKLSVNGNDGTGVDDNNNSTNIAEEVLSYP